MRHRENWQFFLNIFLRIDLFSMILTVLFSLLNLGIVKKSNIEIDFNLVRLFIFWLVLTKAGIDLLFIDIDVFWRDFSGELNSKTNSFYKDRSLFKEYISFISTMLILSSLIPFSQLFLLKRVAGFEYSNIFLLVFYGLILIQKTHAISQYDEMIESFLVTFIIPAFVVFLHQQSMDILLIFTSFPFFLLTYALLVMRNISYIKVNVSFVRNGILTVLDMVIVFFIIVVLVVSGSVSIIILPLIGVGVSLFPEIAFLFFLTPGFVLMLLKSINKGNRYFENAFLLLQVIIGFNLLLYFKALFIH